ncbi:MAG: hypothetical protein B6I35_00740 [Anaerolineaceae bacterium 4572_32.2]|nr:MAG: hypothetical protein B6I35_00740 [Anaerolineaceae bacterium 4572_32.2]
MTNLNIPVALKEMTPAPQADSRTLAQLRQQFKREAQVVAGLDHPNLVRVTDYFSWGESECLVMNFVEGGSLAERIQREGALPEAQVLEWARQLLDALAYCHARGVIHRDIKPLNVIITPENKPVLVDFGLVKLWDPRDPRTQTVVRAIGAVYAAARTVSARESTDRDGNPQGARAADHPTLLHGPRYGERVARQCTGNHCQAHLSRPRRKACRVAGLGVGTGRRRAAGADRRLCDWSRLCLARNP